MSISIYYTAYDTQREQNNRLASERVRIAEREEMDAGRSPAGSAEKQRHIRAAEFERSMAEAEMRIAAEAGVMAKRLRRQARSSPSGGPANGVPLIWDVNR